MYGLALTSLLSRCVLATALRPRLIGQQLHAHCRSSFACAASQPSLIGRQLYVHCRSTSASQLFTRGHRARAASKTVSVALTLRPTWCAPSISHHSHCAKNFATSSEAPEKEESLKVEVKGRGELDIPWVWLRDHCRCPACYNVDTFQKNVDAVSLDGLVLLQSGVDGDCLSVQWQDGHISKYSLEWLRDNFHSPGPQAQVERFLWDGPRIDSQQLPITTFHQHMNSQEGLKNTLSNLLRYGFSIVDGAPASEEGTELVTSRISFMLQTIYGHISTMVSGQLDHADTAYTSLPLGAHTDNTYFHTPAGVQVFHLLEHDGEGGSTLLVDGFYAAEELRRTDPQAFRCLTTTPVPHEFVDQGRQHLYAVGTVLTTDPLSDQLTQIRFNPYDRAALRTVSKDEVGGFYSSYQALTHVIRRDSSALWLRLTPGMVLLVDNWRVMHGRSAFTGRRALCSCYLPHDDWTSLARVLGLL